MTSLQIERFGPIVFALVCGAGWWCQGGAIPETIAKELLAALLSGAAVGAGFLTTAMSIILPMGATRVGRRLKKRGKLPYLIGYLRAAIYGCLLLVVASVAGFFQIAPGAGLTGFWGLLLVLACAYCAASMVRVVEILIKVLAQMAEPENLNG